VTAAPPPRRRDLGGAPPRPPTPTELLGFADEVMSAPTASLEGRWPVAAALLIRQALERVLVELWRAREPGVEAANLTVQLLCLPLVVDERLARRVAWTWSALSRASHHHAYELPPTASELSTWFDATEALVREVTRVTKARPA
jgi:hypothetical protein